MDTPPKMSAPGQAQGRETILVVDDEAPVRTLATRALEARGYRVLVAADGVEALSVADAYPDPIHLLLTDIVMPHGNGVSLSRTLVAKRRDMTVLYMSGYRADTLQLIAEVIAPGRMLQKPFTVETLVERVRAVLDEVTSKPSPPRA